MSFTHLQLEAALAAMMEGQTPEQVEATQAVPAATLKKWARKHHVKDWLEVPKLGKLLRSGWFHPTSRECLQDSLETKLIPPSTTGQFRDWKLTDPTIAEELKSVALFDFQSVSSAIAASRILAFAGRANYLHPAVLLQLDRARLGPVVPWSAQIQKENPYRIALPNVEAWHEGPIAWEAVIGCWTWSKRGQLQGLGWFPKSGVELLHDFSALLSDPEGLIKAISSLDLVPGR